MHFLYDIICYHLNNINTLIIVILFVFIILLVHKTHILINHFEFLYLVCVIKKTNKQIKIIKKNNK